MDKHTPTPHMGTSPGYIKLIAEQLGVTLETAGYIVRAVNMHEELISMLTFLKQSIGPGMDYEEVIALQGQIGQVISKAEGK
jgi:hypothetical protein